MAGPAGKTSGGSSFSNAIYAPGYRSLLPLSPVYLTVEEIAQTFDVNWVRRGRIGGDDWQVVDIQVGEDREEYSVRIFNAEAQIYETIVTQPSVSIQQNELSGPPLLTGQSLEFRVAQISGSVGEGPAAIHSLQLN